MNKVKCENNKLGNYIIIDQTYYPNPLSLKSRLSSRFNKYTTNLIEKN